MTGVLRRLRPLLTLLQELHPHPELVPHVPGIWKGVPEFWKFACAARGGVAAQIGCIRGSTDLLLIASAALLKHAP